jgi:hypothetical protein
MQDLTNKQKDLCGYGGTFGAMIATTVLIQHFNFMGSHWIAYSMIAIYLFAIVSFILLALQKSIAPLLLIITCILVFLAEAVLVISIVFSLVVFILLVYTIIMTVIVYMEQLPKTLKEKALLIKTEEDSWQEKL